MFIIELVYVGLPDLEYCRVKWQSGTSVCCRHRNRNLIVVEMEET